MLGLKIGYTRVSTQGPGLTAQCNALTGLGKTPDWIYVDTPAPREPAQDCARPWRPAEPAMRSSSPRSTAWLAPA